MTEKTKTTRLQPVHKATMLKEVREKGQWIGHIAPSNVNSFHVNDGWHLGHQITIKKVESEFHVVREYETMELGSYIRNFQTYNCIAELGKRVRFWH